MVNKETLTRRSVAEVNLDILTNIYTSHYYNLGNQKKPTVNFHHMDGLGLPELLNRQERSIHIVKDHTWDVYAYVQADCFYLTYPANVDEDTPGFMLITPRAAKIFILATSHHAERTEHEYIVKYYPSYRQSPIYLFNERVSSPLMHKDLDKLHKFTYETYLDMITCYRDVDRVPLEW